MGMALPDVDAMEISAVQKKVFDDRGKELREAVPIPAPMVAMLESALLHMIKVQSDPAAVFIWWVLVLIYASLRFNDGVHVAPDSLELNEDGLSGIVWQTKVERRRRGTRFAVPLASLSGSDWLSEGWTVFQQFKQDRDFFLWNLASEDRFGHTVITAVSNG